MLSLFQIYDLILTYFFLHLVVNASLSETTYLVNEEEGFIEVCVVLDGLIEREVVLQVMTIEGSAKSEHSIF